MKNIYLVKKDPLLPVAPENWITMTGKEFAAFMATPEGKKRESSFGRLGRLGAGDGKIVAECGIEKAREWKRESNRTGYRKDKLRTVGYEDCFRNGVRDDTESLFTGPELVADEDTDVEETVMRKIMGEEVRKAVLSLDREERDLIWKLFLSAHPVSEAAYAREKGLSRHQVSFRKEQTFQKLELLLSGKRELAEAAKHSVRISPKNIPKA